MPKSPQSFVFITPGHIIAFGRTFSLKKAICGRQQKILLDITPFSSLPHVQNIGVIPHHEIRKVVGHVHVEYMRYEHFLSMAPPEHEHHTSHTPHLHNGDEDDDDHDKGVNTQILVGDMKKMQEDFTNMRTMFVEMSSQMESMKKDAERQFLYATETRCRLMGFVGRLEELRETTKNLAGATSQIQNLVDDLNMLRQNHNFMSGEVDRLDHDVKKVCDGMGDLMGEVSQQKTAQKN